jgi:uncharacterized protein (TIGR03435 family)
MGEIVAKVAAALVLLAGVASAQPRFETASARPVEKFVGNFPIRRIVGGPGTESPGRIEYREMSLKDLLFNAFRVQFFQLRTQSWMEDVFFDVRATVPAGATRDDVAQMLQGLLAERFKLKIRRETRDVRGYVMTVAKEGAKVTESPAVVAPAEPARRGGFDLDKDGFVVLPPGTTSLIAIPSADGVRRLTGARVTMRVFAGYLRRELQQPVADETGLKGMYDFRVAYTPEVATPGNTGPPEASGPDVKPAPTLLQALDRQLGLKMVSRPVPTEILTIEHIELRPVEN